MKRSEPLGFTSSTGASFWAIAVAALLALATPDPRAPQGPMPAALRGAL